MLKRIAFLLLATTALSAEIPRNSLEKTAFNPDPNAEPVSTHPVSKKASEPELDPRPIYKTEERTNGRARIAPVRPQGQIVKYDQMLADQPNSAATEVNRVDNQQIPNYAFVPGPAEVAYPDIPYAPGYGYENGYPPSSGYDMYGNSVGNYIEPDTTPFGLFWSQVPDSREISPMPYYYRDGYKGRPLKLETSPSYLALVEPENPKPELHAIACVKLALSFLIKNFSALILGSAAALSICKLTSLCSQGATLLQLKREIRSLATPQRIKRATEFVEKAIRKYNAMQ
ncbi:hypothetical protein MSG28_008012 [Choristoneura fumiferana]|uniref:Uncharacterized protein n=1 Tax=Choristoneura fumiferana TaxID=7141 RepID=A0ACC0J9P5_CHOFU|nr:hypothetical protein MSG28_008012 [Choristoneura fumiferana]